MLFNSYIYIFAFVPIVFFTYFLLNRYRLIKASKAFLIISSLFFYSWWNISYLPLLLISIVVNFYVSKKMILLRKEEHKLPLIRIFFWSGIIFNIAFLGYFKYMDFFISTANMALGVDIELLNIALPLAISFFTIQQIAYLIDVYEGLTEEKNVMDYLIFVTFFPQLIAGPIVHHKEMIPQFEKYKNKYLNYKHIVMGLFLFSIGLFKKVVIADTFASYASPRFDVFESLSFLDAWLASLSYTFQVYFDFSGYSDMAIGVALLFNIKLPVNFDSPLRARNVIEFWQRWHITLTQFITIYLYTAMVRNLKKITFEKTMLITVFTMVIVGIWHGASWAWILFGFFHGCVMVINHYWKKTKIKIPYLLSWFLTFNFLNLTLVLVRAKDYDSMMKVYTGMMSNPFEGSGLSLFSICLLAGTILFIHIKTNSTSFYRRMDLNRMQVVGGALLLVVAIIFLSQPTEFIYFNF